MRTFSSFETTRSGGFFSYTVIAAAGGMKSPRICGKQARPIFVHVAFAGLTLENAELLMSTTNQSDIRTCGRVTSLYLRECFSLRYTYIVNPTKLE